MVHSSQLAISKLKKATNGIQCSNAIIKLSKFAKHGDIEAAQALAEYVTSGSVMNSRSIAACVLSNLLPFDGLDFSQYFIDGLKDPSARYYSMVGLARSLGVESYPYLVAIALNLEMPSEHRAKAIVELSCHSLQPFDRSTNRNLSKWQPDDFRTKEIENWRELGFPSGRGCEPPPRDAALDAPDSSLEKAAAKFDALLSVARANDRRNRTNPANYLSPADQSDLLLISRKWALPQRYFEFLKRFSPDKIICQLKLPGYGSGFCFYGARELIAGQVGYSVQVTSEPLECWPQDYICIGNSSVDPFVLDLSSIQNGDCPVLTAKHGQGSWDFRSYSRSFEAFLTRITVDFSPDRF